MIALTRLDLFAPMEPSDPAPWLVATALFGLAWIGLILAMIRRSLRSSRARERARKLARSWGGYGPPLLGGHQPVATSVITSNVIAGRLRPDALRRIRKQVRGHELAGDPRLRLRPDRQRRP